MGDPKVRRTIDRMTYLQAVGMFTAAKLYSTRADEMVAALKAHLRIDDSHVVDLVYARGEATVREFDEALCREKIDVAPEVPDAT